MSRLSTSPEGLDELSCFLLQQAEVGKKRMPPYQSALQVAPGQVILLNTSRGPQ